MGPAGSRGDRNIYNKQVVMLVEVAKAAVVVVAIDSGSATG